MKDLFQKYWMPWTAEASFPTPEAFQQWLQRCRRRFDNLRVLALVLAALFLIGGYVLDHRPTMLISILPLAAVLLLSLMISKTEALQDLPHDN